MFVGDGRWFSPPPHSYPAHIAPLPSSLPQEAKEGEGGGGGAGLPLGTAVAQSISPKPRNFLLPKRKKKKKISQRPPFLPAPLGQLRLDLWGFPGGWLRAGTLSGKSGGVPCQALRQAHFGLLPSPLLPLQANHQRWPSPDLRPLGWRPGRLGAGAGVPRSPEAGGWRRLGAGRLGTGLGLPPHCILCPSFPRGWAFPSTSCCGDGCSPPQKVCAIFSHPLLGRRRGDPRAGRGGDRRADGLPGPQGLPRLLISGIGTMASSFLGEPLSESTAPSPVLSPLPLFIGINLGTS